MNSYQPRFWEMIIQRIETKTVALVISSFFAIAGFVMVLLGIKGNQTIDMNTALFEGKLRTGSMGVIVMFFSMLIIFACVLRPAKPHTFELKKGDLVFKWTAKVGSIDHNLLTRLGEILDRFKNG